ncbi:MAG: ribonuclease R [Acidobacteria bacterium]|nr:ribonuclease R [Acidobacteriota bacterium]
MRPRDRQGRQDFRRWPTVTIDGESARDFDDAVTIERLPNGNFWLGVHIADVARYVQEGSALDAEAIQRGTSVYFPDRAIHMFPEALATGLCSLRPQVDRLVQSCLMEVDARGDVRRYELYDGVIRSDARMTYAEVNAILTGGDPGARKKYRRLVPHLELMAELFEVLNGRRRARGSVDFDLPEAKFLMDDQGRVEAIVAAERNLAHRLIEEFMLAANETVARHLEDNRMPALFRVHESPDPAKVAEFEAFAASLGFSLGGPAEHVTPGHFQRLLRRVHGKPEERPLAFLMLRTMQQARYDPANLGHFGLAAPAYAHFTSPIRRYPDLVVHRALRELRARTPDTERRERWREDLPELARRTSAVERRAEEAEREIVQWKKVRFMAGKVGDEFTGYVIGVTAFGLFVELTEHFVEGLVHISSMADDYYRHLEGQHALRGENTKKVYRLGDPVRVQLVRVDRERRQLELALVEVLDHVRVLEGRRDRPRRRDGRKTGGTIDRRRTRPRRR